MKNIVKNEIVLLDPYSEALCPTPQKNKVKKAKPGGGIRESFVFRTQYFVLVENIFTYAFFE